MDESLLWTKVAAIGQGAGAVATFAAVVASLWIAHSERRAHIKVTAGLRIIAAGDGSPFEDAISILITNFGLRPVRISTVGWRTGWTRMGPKWFKFQHAVQQFDLPMPSIASPQPPFDLGPGQEANLIMPPHPFISANEFREAFFCRHLPFHGSATATKVCVAVYLVAAKKSVTRVEKSLEQFLGTGIIAKGAAAANEAADQQRAARRTS